MIVADVYEAGEQPIPGADRDGLVEGLRARGHRQVIALEASEALARTVQELCRAGRSGGLPRRRQHHRLGQCPAGGAAGLAGRLRHIGRRGAMTTMAAIQD